MSRSSWDISRSAFRHRLWMTSSGLAALMLSLWMFVVNYLFEETTMLSNEKHYHPWLYLEAIEIFKHKNCLNRQEESLKINKTWYPALENCKTKQSVTSKNMNTEHDQSGHSLPNTSQSNDSSKQKRVYKAPTLRTTQQSTTNIQSDNIRAASPEDVIHRRWRNVDLEMSRCKYSTWTYKSL